MKRLLLLALVLTVTCGASTVQAAAPRHVQRAPVVATWFSELRPVSGQPEVLSVQFSQGNHGLAGRRFSAIIRYGRHVIHLRGGTTNGHGVASVAFTVPRGLKGKVLLATTTVVFEGRRYLGSNHVTVVR
jgi:hypothetical protein